MTRPPTMEEAETRGLVATRDAAIHTFSNGDQWDYWSARNCDRCKWWNEEAVGDCAFEAYAFLHLVSPALAQLFGWLHDDAYEMRSAWHPPEQCAFFTERSEDDDDEPPTPPFVDPTQMTFLAPEQWPTVAPVPVEVGV